MLNKLLRLIFTVLGGLLGYGIFLLIDTIAEKSGSSMQELFTVQQQIIIAAVLVSVLALIFYKFSPSVLKRTSKLADDISKDLSNVSTGTIVSGYSDSSSPDSSRPYSCRSRTGICHS